MIFANVTDITIPQGNVIKIHETNSGRVLWEKKSDVYTKVNIIPADRLIYSQNSTVDETQYWITNSSSSVVLNSDTRWFVNISDLPVGLCVKCRSNGNAYLGINDQSVVMPKGYYYINLLVINPVSRVYDEGTVLFSNTSSEKKSIARAVEYSYIAPDISTAPEFKRA